MKVKIKICGIRTLKQAVTALDARADFIGLQFVPSSKRKIDFLVAKDICDNFKGKIRLVGVFQNQPLDKINVIAKDLNLDYIQLHGNENNEFCKKIIVPVIKSIGLPPEFDVSETIQKMKKYTVHSYLIDREKRGEGEMVSLEKTKELIKKFRIFFAGGLNPENVSQVIKEIQPFAVDVAAGIETNGMPNPEKIKLFIKNAKI